MKNDKSLRNSLSKKHLTLALQGRKGRQKYNMKVNECKSLVRELGFFEKKKRIFQGELLDVLCKIITTYRMENQLLSIHHSKK